MRTLNKQIKKTKEIVQEGEINYRIVSADAVLILENQLVMLKTLKEMSEKMKNLKSTL